MGHGSDVSWDTSSFPCSPMMGLDLSDIFQCDFLLCINGTFVGDQWGSPHSSGPSALFCVQTFSGSVQWHSALSWAKSAGPALLCQLQLR